MERVGHRVHFHHPAKLEGLTGRGKNRSCHGGGHCHARAKGMEDHTVRRVLYSKWRSYVQTCHWLGDFPCWLS